MQRLHSSYPRVAQEIAGADVACSDGTRSSSARERTTGWPPSPPYVARTASTSSPTAAITASIASGVTPGMSPSATTAQSASGISATPQRSDAAIPSSHSRHTTGSALANLTAAAISSATAPSTTTTRSSDGTASIASIACCSRGTPSSSASCLGDPNRRAPPAASTRPAITP